MEGGTNLIEVARAVLEKRDCSSGSGSVHLYRENTWGALKGVSVGVCGWM